METSSIEARLEKMEKANRVWRCAYLLSLALFVVAFLGIQRVQAQDGNYIASSYILRSPNGKMRGGLVASDDKGCDLELYDESEVMRAKIGVPKSGAPYLILFDASQKTRLSVTLTDTDEPLVCLYDAKQRLQLDMATSTDGPRLDLTDGDRNRLSLIGTPTAYFMAVTNASGKIIWSAP